MLLDQLHVALWKLRAALMKFAASPNLITPIHADLFQL